MTLRRGASGWRGEALYGLAFLGAQLAFTPLLVLLLPRRVAALAGDDSLAALSTLVLVGGGVASVAHIGAGALGDFWLARFGSRRGVIALGMAGVVGAYAWLARAASLPALAIGVVAFQLALNLMFAPLGALMADYVPDARKGRVAGWLNAGLPVAGLSVAALAWWAPADDAASFAAVAAAVALLVVPLLVGWPFGAGGQAPPPPAEARAAPLAGRDLALAWSARCLMQAGATLLVGYLYLYVAALARRAGVATVPGAATAVGTLAVVATAAAVTGAIVAGHASDARRQRPALMVAAAVAAAVALAGLAEPRSWLWVLVAYGAFQAALAAYLTIDAALVAELVGRHPRRGAWLGVMNLTNTVPAIVVALLALAGATHERDFAALRHILLGCSGGAVAAAGLAGRIGAPARPRRMRR